MNIVYWIRAWWRTLKHPPGSLSWALFTHIIPILFGFGCGYVIVLFRLQCDPKANPQEIRDLFLLMSGIFSCFLWVLLTIVVLVGGKRSLKLGIEHAQAVAKLHHDELERSKPQKAVVPTLPNVLLRPASQPSQTLLRPMFQLQGQDQALLLRPDGSGHN